MGNAIYSKTFDGMAKVRNIRYFQNYINQFWNAEFPNTPDKTVDFPYQIIIYVGGSYTNYFLLISTTPTYVDSDAWVWSKDSGSWKSYELVGNTWSFIASANYAANEKVFATYHGSVFDSRQSNYDLYMVDEKTLYFSQSVDQALGKKAIRSRNIRRKISGGWERVNI